MDPIQKKLQLDRQELTIVGALVLMLAGLTFTVGVIVGYGLKPSGVPTASGHEADSHGSRAPASVEKEKRVSKSDHAKSAPAEGVPAGAGLKKAYSEAKQKSLLDATLREPTSAEVPKSIADTNAHLQATKRDNRSPASETEPESGNKTAADVKTPEVAPGPKGDVAKALFERSANSKDAFNPVSGSYTVQIASFASGDESRARVDRLRSQGFTDAYAQTVKLPNGETWYRVSVGSFPSPQWAKKTGEKLIKRKLASDFVIRQVN
jgi:cell division septation protein DedD